MTFSEATANCLGGGLIATQIKASLRTPAALAAVRWPRRPSPWGPAEQSGGAAEALLPKPFSQEEHGRAIAELRAQTGSASSVE